MLTVLAAVIAVCLAFAIRSFCWDEAPREKAANETTWPVAAFSALPGTTGKATLPTVIGNLAAFALIMEGGQDGHVSVYGDHWQPSDSVISNL